MSLVSVQEEESITKLQLRAVERKIGQNFMQLFFTRFKNTLKKAKTFSFYVRGEAREFLDL